MTSERSDKDAFTLNSDLQILAQSDGFLNDVSLSGFYNLLNHINDNNNKNFYICCLIGRNIPNYRNMLKLCNSLKEISG
ncbi:PIR Superfamily Protein [Plasmodium ovale curtisi]|uniref:PIR Superfamily Protein n=1 Tax=Plasmodium ovale curtisi TaxID=864141 RepID=A0A1A8X5Y0_PLAOA|nr:PIR Superfamily Protein [Plasmodium ovale curtisi]